MNRLLTTEEAAEYLGKSSWWLRENISRLGIPAFKIGRQWRYRKEDLDLWLDAHKVA
jgi:excisionase family DNA binding protein